MRARRTPMAMAALAALALLGAACGSGGGDQPGAGGTSSTALGTRNTVTGPVDAGEPQRGGKMVWGIEAEPDGLDPSRSRFAVSSQMVASAVFDPITTVDDAGHWVPHLAEKLEPNADFTTWTIVLRPNVTFTDGEPLDGEALKTNLDYWSKSFITATALTSMDSYEVTGPRSVTIKMNQPWAAFPYILSSQIGYVAAPNWLTNPEPGPPLHPIGTGPFKLRSYTKGDSFEFERNPGYWRSGLPYLDAMTFKFIPDADERLSKLQKGDIDAMHAYQSQVVLKVREDAAAGKLKAVENGEGEADMISINVEKPPFDDLTARRALAHATDAARWRRQVNQDVPTEARSPFAPGHLGYSTDDHFPAYDPALAKQLVDEYTTRTGKPIEFPYLVYGDTHDLQEAQLLTDQWAAVGIRATPQLIDQSALVARVVLNDYVVSDWRNFGGVDPDLNYVWWSSKSIRTPPLVSTNVARYADPQIDQAMDDARGSTDEARRQRDYEIAAQRLNDGVAYVWLGRTTWTIAAIPRVNGLSAAANGTGASLTAKTWLATLWMSR